MTFDEMDLENTARAVFIMNESSREKYSSWEDLRSFIVSMAYCYGNSNKSVSFSTGGFQLTFFVSPDNSEEIFCRTSVSSYTANRYVKMMTERMKQISDIAVSV
jgi:hypothetical protein